MNFQEWVEQRYARPVVIVESSTEADKLCNRSGLDVIHLLRPHSVYTENPLYARVSDRSNAVACRNFGVRFTRLDCVRDVGRLQLLQHSRRLLRSAASMDIAYGKQIDRLLGEVFREVKFRHRKSPRPVPLTVVSTNRVATVPTQFSQFYPTWNPLLFRDIETIVRCSSFDTLDYPIGVIHVVSTSEMGGIEGVLQLFRRQAQRVQDLRAALPGMDGELHRYYLILHDMTSPSSPSLATVRQMLTSVQQLYGTNHCALVKLNSVRDPRLVKNLDPAQWVEASPPAMDVPSRHATQMNTAVNPPSTSSSPMSSTTNPPTPSSYPFRLVQDTCGVWEDTGAPKTTGCHLSPDDIAELHTVMSYYLSQSLFNFIERRLRVTDITVQDRRTTTLGKMAAWFKGKEDTRQRKAEVTEQQQHAGEEAPVQPQYLSQSLEMQMRHCGDLSLVLHDYEGAIGYYRLCIEELLETLPQRPYNRGMLGGCQEAIGIAQLFLRKLAPPSTAPWYIGVSSSSNRVSSHTCRWEVALNDYIAANKPDHAVRLTFLLYDFCRTQPVPLLNRARALLLHLQRSGLLQHLRIVNGVVEDLLAGIALFSNTPYSTDLAVQPQLPNDSPMFICFRQYAHHLQRAGFIYTTNGATEQGLRCYLSALELFRLVDPAGTWEDIVEHLYLTTAALYTKLGKAVKGLTMTSAAVAQGSALYRNPETSERAVEAFWEQQRGVLAHMGYAVCPHMPMPCIARSSFLVDRNYYGIDTVTEDVTHRLTEAATEVEWRTMEYYLRRVFTDTILPNKAPGYHFPVYAGPHHGANESPFSPSSSSVALMAGSPIRRHSYCSFASQMGELRHYTIAKSEPLVLSFLMRNTVGCPIEATGLALLYVSKSMPEQLWKSSNSKTVRLDPGSHERQELLFDPVEEGEYIIIGLCWVVKELEGYYYFATKEARTGCLDSLFEYAMEHPRPVIDAEENIHVTVTHPRACLVATLDPPLPPQLYDGEYFHTKLVITNQSSSQDAGQVMLQRNGGNAHLMYFGEVDRQCNLDMESPLLLTDHLAAKESRAFPVTIRSQHHRGNTATQCSDNYFFFLIGYLPWLEADLSKNGPTSDGGHRDENGVRESSPPPCSSPLAVWPTHVTGGAQHFSGQKMVRLHRVLRRCEVRPSISLHATVLPPSNAALSTAVVVTAKNISGETAGSSVAVSPSHVPLRVARVVVTHSPRWNLHCNATKELVEDRAVQCLLATGGSLTLPLQVRRLPGSSHNSFLMDINAGEVEPTYVDTTCLALHDALPSEKRSTAVEASIGKGIANSPANMFFLQTSYLGAGDVWSQCGDDGSGGGGPGGFVFYADKKGQSKNEQPTAAELRSRQAEEEQWTCGGVLERYTPIAVAVTWVRDDGHSIREGQLFLFINPMEAVYHSAVIAASSKTEVQPEPTSTSTEEAQQELCQAMLVHYTSVKLWQGALAYHVQVPPLVEITSCQTAAVAAVPVTLNCLSLAPMPILVTAEAMSPTQSISARSSIPLLFTGKTLHRFIVMPSEKHQVNFTAHLLCPGMVDVNSIHVTASPLCFLHHSVPPVTTAKPTNASPLMWTGMTLAALVRGILKNAETPKSGLYLNSSTTPSANTRILQAAHDLSADAGSVASIISVADSYEARAAALLRQLTPAGLAGDKRHCITIIGSQTPAFTNVHLKKIAAKGTSGVGSVTAATCAVGSLGAQQDPQYSEVVQGFFRQLSSFEQELQKMSNVKNPFSYVYRPTVKAIDPTTITVASTTAVVTTPTSATTSPTTQQGEVAVLSRDTDPAISSKLDAIIDFSSTSGPWARSASLVEGREVSLMEASLRRSIVQTGAAASVAALDSIGDAMENPASPLHLPVVAFEGSAAGLPLDVVESDNVPLPPSSPVSYTRYWEENAEETDSATAATLSAVESPSHGGAREEVIAAVSPFGGELQPIIPGTLIPCAKPEALVQSDEAKPSFSESS